jgi:hypothetical protein
VITLTTERPRNRGSITGDKILPSPQAKTECWAHAASYSMATAGSCPGGKVAEASSYLPHLLLRLRNSVAIYPLPVGVTLRTGEGKLLVTGVPYPRQPPEDQLERAALLRVNTDRSSTIMVRNPLHGCLLTLRDINTDTTEYGLMTGLSIHPKSNIERNTSRDKHSFLRPNE